MRTIVPSLLLGSLVFVMILYLNASHSELLQDMKFAIMGNKAMASFEADSPDYKERTRTQRINSLLISVKNKRDLSDGRPFWGAAQHMLELALGVPADNAVIRSKDGVVYEFHTFDVEPEPIVFEFQNNKLACAHYSVNRKSVCDSQSDSYYGDASELFSSAEANAAYSR